MARFPLVPLLAAALGAGSAHAASQRILFLDGRGLSDMHGVERRLHSPVPREVAFRMDAAWEGGESGYAAVVRGDDGWRMYYRGGGDHSREVACLMASADGIAWTRPVVGQFAFDGSTANNIVLMPERPHYGEAHNFFPFRDDAAGVADDERWKAVALTYWFPEGKDGEGRRVLVTLASADGIAWRRLDDKPAIDRGGGFDSLNVAFRDPWTNEFACFSRVGVDGFRHVQRSTSTDFRSWSGPVALGFPEPPRTHFYTNGILPLPRLRDDDEGRWYIGMPMRFVPERKEAFGVATDGLSDAVLIASRDGVAWDWVGREAWIRPGPGKANWGNAHGNMTPVHGIAETGEAEWSVYWMEGYGSQAPQVRRGTMRAEGFASLHAGAGTGTARVAVEGDLRGARLLLNASTSAAGNIRIAVLDGEGKPLPGHGLDDCRPVWGDGLYLPVAWGEGRTAIGGNPAPEARSLLVELADADLFAVRAVRD